MKRIFGQKKEVAPAPTLGDAGAKIDSRVTGLDEKIRKLDVELAGYKEKLKRAKGPAQKTLKQRAMAVLRRKRMYEQQRDQLAGQAFNIEQTNFTIDSVKDTITTVDAMKAASKTLKTEFKKVDIDKIEDLYVSRAFGLTHSQARRPRGYDGRHERSPRCPRTVLRRRRRR